METYIVSGDKDFMQLVNDSVFVYTPGSMNNPTTIFDREKVKEKWSVPPEKIIDLLGLMGDSSDNVPGVRGVGAKTAVKLLNEYDTVENILDHAEEVKNKRAREGLLNGKQIAILSRELVTIKTDVPLELSVNDLKQKQFDFDSMTKLFRELEFFRLQKQLEEFKGPGAQHPAPMTEHSAPSTQPPALSTQNSAPRTKIPKNYSCLDSVGKMEKWISELKKAKLVSVDIESTSTDPMLAEIVGFSFSVKKDEGWYVPIQFPEKEGQLFGGEDDLKTVLDLIKPILEEPKIPKCGQNIKYDALILKRHGIEIQGIAFDTMIAAHLLKPEERSYKLDYLSLEYIKYEMQSITDLIGSGRNQISMSEVPVEKVTYYAAEDADVALQLVPLLKKRLREDQLLNVAEDIEFPMIPVLLQMECSGVYVEKPMMEEMSLWMEKKLDTFTREIHSLAGTEFNINSPQQMAVILFDRLSLPKIRQRSTDVNVLKTLKYQHPLPEKVLGYRKFQKLKSTYVDAIPKLIHPDTNRIHSSFSQTVAATGRLSSSNPNFQNIPIREEEGREIRKAFKPQEKGWVIFSADYSQIELRIMAHLSGDETLKKAFLEGEDIHAHTASNIYGVPVESVLPEMRRTAKVVNFGVMYGAGPFRMSQELGIPQSESKIVIKTYFDRYPGIRSYIDSTLKIARNKNYVETILGRRRYCYDINNTNQRIRTAVERAVINMPIQGTAAEMIKLAMIKIHEKLKNLKTIMILQIHDELLFEVPEDELDEVKQMVIEEMESAMSLDIPIVVDNGVGESWYEAL